MRELEFIPPWYVARRRRDRVRATRTRWTVIAMVIVLVSLAIKSILRSAPSPANAAARASWISPPLTIIAPASAGHSIENGSHGPEKGTEPDNAPLMQEKSFESKADQDSERQQRLHNLRQQAAVELHLQSTVISATPKALVNGELLGEGDVVACGSVQDRTRYRVLKIEARRIIVEHEGIKLEIPMKNATMPQEK